MKMSDSNYKNTIFSMCGKVSVVVGGSGQIGINSVSILLEAGSEVVILDIVEPDFDTNNDLCLKKLHYFKCDITDLNNVSLVVDEVVEKFKVIDCLVNHSHFKGDPKRLKPHSEFFAPVEDYPLEIWSATIDVNLTGLFLICQKFGKVMRNQNHGVIINTASTYGIVSARESIYGDSGINSPVSYAATKAAIINLSRYLSTHWAKYNIRVNTLSPGGVANKNQSDDFVNNYSDMTPLARMARPDEYQGAILFLASEASSYMTGSNLIIDGGWTAW
jgi:NAD(P)-dependent dehydrogenase (short-subunit alcohol dehydrogenase family)